MTVPSTPMNDALLPQHATPVVGIGLRRTALFAVGLALVCAAQYVFSQMGTTFVQQLSAFQLQDYFRIDSLNLENSITGFMLLMVGGFILVKSQPPYPLHADDPPDDVGRIRLLRYLRRDGPILLAAAVILGLAMYQAHLADSSSGLVFIWLSGLALLVLAAYRFDRDTGAVLSLGLKRIDLFWIAALFVGGIAIGAYQLDMVPNSLVRDEGNFFERASIIAQGDDAMSFFDVGVYSYPLPSSLYQGAVLQIFGISLWSWRFSSVLAGVLTVIPLYLLAREMFDRRTAVVSCLLLITLPYFLAFARLGYNNSQAIFPVALAMCFLYLAVRRSSALYYVLSGIAAGLAFYTYTAGRLGAVVGGVFLVWLTLTRLLAWFRAKPAAEKAAALRDFRRLLAGTVTFAVVGFATLLPQVLYTNTVAPDLLRYKTLESLFPNVNYALAFFNESELYRDNPPIKVGEETFFFRPDLYARLLVRGVVRSLLVFEQGSLVTEHYMNSPLAGPLSAVFYGVGLAVSLVHLRRREFLLIVFWWFGGTLLLSMINTFPPRYQHMVPIIPAITLLAAVGLVTSVDVLTRVFRLPARRLRVNPLRRSLAVVPLAVLVVVLAAIGLVNLRTYFVEMPQRYTPGFEDIMAFNALHLNEPTTVIYIYNPDTDPYDDRWRPWVINNMPTRAVYQNVSTVTLAMHGLTLQPGRPILIYFRPADASLVEAEVKQVLRRDDIQPTVYYDDLLRTIGMSYSISASDFAAAAAGG